MEELNSASGSAHGQHRGAFEDMSRLRFLVVDEADRMMEDGHFSEVRDSERVNVWVDGLVGWWVDEANKSFDWFLYSRVCYSLYSYDALPFSLVYGVHGTDC